MLLVDYSPMVMSIFFANCDRVTKQIDPKVFRGLILNSLRAINFKHRRRFGSPIIAVDAKKETYWRKRFFAKYKDNRVSDPDVDWETVFGITKEVLQDIKEYFPWQVVEVDAAEADDIIAILTMTTRKPVMIISPDGDFKQLQFRKNVNQFDNIRGRVITTDHAL